MRRTKAPRIKARGTRQDLRPRTKAHVSLRRTKAPRIKARASRQDLCPRTNTLANARDQGPSAQPPGISPPFCFRCDCRACASLSALALAAVTLLVLLRVLRVVHGLALPGVRRLLALRLTQATR